MTIPLLIALSLAADGPADTCASRIIDYGSWAEAPGQQWDYRADRIDIIGAEHSRDPDHPQFKRIAELFDSRAPTIVFYEGPDRGTGTDAADTIRTTGESGYLRFLAKRQNIEIRRLEPSPQEQFGALLQTFPSDQVLLYFTLREAARLRDREQLNGLKLDQAVDKLLEKVAALGLPALPFKDSAGLGPAFARYWSGRDWRAVPGNWFSPNGDDTETGSLFTRKINRADSGNRNRHFLKVISAALAEGKRPFVVVGRNHVPLLAPALDCRLREEGLR